MTGVDCVVVGGGPGGMVLAHLIARAGLQVTVLESHQDLDRDFRGDSLHAYTLELLDGLGLADALLEQPHFKASCFRAHTPVGSIVLADYTTLRSRFPYLVLMPQVEFLEYLHRASSTLGGYTLQTGARVRTLIIEDGAGRRGPLGRGCRHPGTPGSGGHRRGRTLLQAAGAGRRAGRRSRREQRPAVVPAPPASR